MEEKNQKKRGFLNGWDALVLIGIILIGSSLIDNYIYNRSVLKGKEIDLDIEREKTKREYNKKVK